MYLGCRFPAEFHCRHFIKSIGYRQYLCTLYQLCIYLFAFQKCLMQFLCLHTDSAQPLRCECPLDQRKSFHLSPHHHLLIRFMPFRILRHTHGHLQFSDIMYKPGYDRILLLIQPHIQHMCHHGTQNRYIERMLLYKIFLASQTLDQIDLLIQMPVLLNDRSCNALQSGGMSALQNL